MTGILIGNLIAVVVRLFTGPLIIGFIDMVLDFVEQFVKGTASDVDDRIVLPICDALRASMDISDNPNPDLVGELVKLMSTLFEGDVLKLFVDYVLDFIETYVTGSKSKIDDLIVLPVCMAIRAILNVPDND